MRESKQTFSKEKHGGLSCLRAGPAQPESYWVVPRPLVQQVEQRWIRIKEGLIYRNARERDTVAPTDSFPSTSISRKSTRHKGRASGGGERRRWAGARESEEGRQVVAGAEGESDGGGRSRGAGGWSQRAEGWGGGGGRSQRAEGEGGDSGRSQGREWRWWPEPEEGATTVAGARGGRGDGGGSRI
ncbi:hypothetical protein OsI_01503 [Oryza sativa Indica Group]|uniref:Uncharacterized protein n=1 Tax=Oryza sativa subsp. indica TaxID=39946 RepID=B8A6N0_ORYSI|nr:hypothetical protein OsI_01503 [Oryza sativa Indica Group]